MSNKKRRKKNNKDKKVFNKNLLIKEEVEARREIAMADDIKREEIGIKKERSIFEKKNVSAKAVAKEKSDNYSENNIFFDIKIFWKKILIKLRKWNNIFCTGMTCRVNLKRDIIIISVAIFLAVLFLGWEQNVQVDKENSIKKQDVIAVTEAQELKIEEQNADNIRTIQENISTNDWREYRSNWYGFKIKYPNSWKNPIVRPINKLSNEIFRVSFLSDKIENTNYEGFDVVIYDVNKTKDYFATAEFPKIKNQELKDSGQCDNIEGHLLETGDYPAEEIYISKTDNCYEAVLFFTLIDGQYMYNIVPILKEGIILEDDPMVRVNDNLPEFFAAISQFENIDIVRPKPKPAPPKITAPGPASYKVVNGRMVCAKKNDKPSKSDKNKKKHLDMECCLDPDEYPNPHCYYDPAKYGKYLK